MVGVMMPGRPIYEDYDHADYDALWECANRPWAAHLFSYSDLA